MKLQGYPNQYFSKIKSKKLINEIHSKNEVNYFKIKTWLDIELACLIFFQSFIAKTNSLRSLSLYLLIIPGTCIFMKMKIKVNNILTNIFFCFRNFVISKFNYYDK